MEISWSIEGEKELSRRLDLKANKLKDFKPPFTEAAKSLKKTFENDVFRTEGAVIEEKWKPLSPLTLALRAKRGQGSKILDATGRMKRSFTYAVSSQEAVIGNVAPYFKYHQSKLPRKRLPRRVMMKLAEEQKQMIVRTFLKHVRKSMSK